MNSCGTSSRKVTYKKVPVAPDSRIIIGFSMAEPVPIFVIVRPIHTPNGAMNEKIQTAVQSTFFFVWNENCSIPVV